MLYLLYIPIYIRVYYTKIIQLTLKYNVRTQNNNKNEPNIRNFPNIPQKIVDSDQNNQNGLSLAGILYIIHKLKPRTRKCRHSYIRVCTTENGSSLVVVLS